MMNSLLNRHCCSTAASAAHHCCRPAAAPLSLASIPSRSSTRLYSGWYDGGDSEAPRGSSSSRGDYGDEPRGYRGRGGGRRDSYGRGRGGGGRGSRGGRGGRGPRMLPGDWACPDCGYSNYASNTECRKCEAPRPEDYQDQVKPVAREGDWDCPSCGAHNFSRRTECFKCNEPAPEEVLAARQQSGYGEEAQPDWTCPECGQQNWARRSFCRACDTPKPDGGEEGGEASSRGPPRERRGEYEGRRDYGGGERRQRREYAPREPREYVAKEGDWTCQECGNNNFAFRTECRRCNAPRP